MKGKYDLIEYDPKCSNCVVCVERIAGCFKRKIEMSGDKPPETNGRRAKKASLSSRQDIEKHWPPKASLSSCLPRYFFFISAYCKPTFYMKMPIDCPDLSQGFMTSEQIRLCFYHIEWVWNDNDGKEQS